VSRGPPSFYVGAGWETNCQREGYNPYWRPSDQLKQEEPIHARELPFRLEEAASTYFLMIVIGRVKTLSVASQKWQLPPPARTSIMPTQFVM